jgi:hypothetical protein
MNAKRFTNEVAARRFARAVDRQWGIDHGGVPLPRQEGPETGAHRAGQGPGVTGPWPRTERYQPLLRRNGEWAYPVDPYVESLHGRELDDGEGGRVTVDTSDAEPIDRESWEPGDGRPETNPPGIDAALMAHDGRLR